MKNIDKYKPTKYIRFFGKFIPSFDNKELNTASFITAYTVLKKYEKNIHYFKGNLIDLGCGKAPFFILYKDKVKNPFLVDWSGNDNKKPNSCIDLNHDLTKKLPLSDNTFNTAILSDVLEHIPEPQKLINEIHRILKPESYLIMNTPFFYPLHEEPNDYYRYTRYALEYMCKNAGFKKVNIEVVGGIVEIIFDILMKILSKLPYIGLILNWLIILFYTILSLTKIKHVINATSKGKYPLGYFCILQK